MAFSAEKLRALAPNARDLSGMNPSTEWMFQTIARISVTKIAIFFILINPLRISKLSPSNNWPKFTN